MTDILKDYDYDCGVWLRDIEKNGVLYECSISDDGLTRSPMRDAMILRVGDDKVVFRQICTNDETAAIAIEGALKYV